MPNAINLMQFKLICNATIKVIVFILLLQITGCGCVEEETLRSTSQNNLVDVVITERNCGAMSGYSYRVFIVPKGKEKSGDPVFLADHVSDLEVKWVNPELLMIGYSNADIYHFTNFEWYTEVMNDRYKIKVRLFEYEKIPASS